MAVRPILDKALRSLERPFAVHNEILISRSAILHNFDLFAGLPGCGSVIPVLKSNAYGHGLEETATILKERSFPYLAVDGYFEALRVRAVSRQPVLVMGAIAPENFARMKTPGISFVVGDEAAATALGRSGKRARVHIELDTGMTRYGVPMAGLDVFLALLKRYPNLEVEGVMSHLADADNPEGDHYSALQAERFDQGVDLVRAAGFAPQYLHLAQSAGSTKVRSEHANTLRVGIGLYGVSPLSPRDPAAVCLDDLRPALELRSTITKVLAIEPGEKVGYGCSFAAKRRSRIGVLPLGYYEGIPWALSNAGHVKCGDEYAPIAGRVCMNHTMIDLTDAKADAGDRVCVISGERGDQQSVDEICSRHKLFNYEFLVRLNQTIRRRIVD